MVIAFEDLTKYYGGHSRPAVADLDITVRDGEVLGLVGLNGAGKTTAIRVGVGAVLPSAGRVLVDQFDIVRDKRRAAVRLGWVPEGFPFDSRARALPMLVYLAGFHGKRGEDARRHCRRLLAQAGLADVERNRLSTFSMGMKKRFALASAMVGEPANLFLDEILNGLDPEGMAFARNWMLEQRTAGRAMLLSSHLLTELQALADRISFLHHGNLVRTIARSDLADQSEVVIRILIEPLDREAVEYLATVGTPRIEGSTVFLSTPRVTPAELVAELVRRQYRVSEVRTEAPSLEAYFLRLIGSSA